MCLHFVCIFQRSKDAGLDYIIQDTFEEAAGKEMSSTEVRRIWFYKGVGEIQREISRIMKRSKNYYSQCNN